MSVARPREGAWRLPPLRPLLVASDLDGTLLPLDSQANPSAVAGVAAGVAALLAAGVRFVVCTGRMFRSARAAVAGLGITRGTIVCYQGALTADLATGERLLVHPVPAPLAAEAVRAARTLGRHVNAYVDDQMRVEQMDRWAELYMRRSGVDCTVDDDLEAVVLASPPEKLLLLTEADDALALLPQLRERWAGRLVVTISQPGYVEITATGATKRAALDFLARRWRVAPARSVACGDGLNDVDMLEWAGFAVAMAEATPEVREAADFVVPQAEIGDLLAALARLPAADRPTWSS